MPTTKKSRKKTAKKTTRTAPTWTFTKLMAELKREGTAQTRKIYARHGVTGDQFGVSYAVLTKLAKAIKTDNDLAIKLWETGNHDARVLATKIIDATQLKAGELDKMAKQVDSYVIADAFATVAGESPHAESRIAKWIAARPTPANEYLIRAGYSAVSANLTARRKAKPSDTDLPDDLLNDLLDRIESTIHDMPNRTREAMNTCLICIGAYRDTLRPRALKIAKSIGKVDIDHGETGCKTPDAATYIAKTVKHNARVPR